MKQLGIVGESVKRRDGIAHVTGQTRYVDDISYPGMLWLKMVRAPVHRGIIHRVDVSKAEAVPGVQTVVTAKDVPNNWYTILCLIGVGPNDEPVLADTEIMWRGEPIAAVVAESEEIAQEAAQLVELEIQELPPVMTIDEALAEGAPAIKKWGSNTFMYDGLPYRKIRFGNVDEAFDRADSIVEGTYQLNPYDHVPVETQTCLVKPEPDGRLTVHSNTQALYFTKDNLGIILQMPDYKIRLVGGTVGGGFGGKVDVVVEPVTAIAAMKTGRPVKWRWTRTEEFRHSSTVGMYRMHYKDGVSKDGHILARKVTSYHDAGAYHRHSPYGVQKHAANLPGPYNIPNVWVDAYCVYTNRQPASALRGFGVTPASFAVEVQMDKIARTLGMDPWQIRFLNAYRNGQLKAVRKVVEDATLIETMQAAAKMVGQELPDWCWQASSNDRQDETR